MITENTGEPAFPVVLDLGQSVEYHKGMTLRDYFAAKASEEDIQFWRPTGRTVQVLKAYDGMGNKMLVAEEVYRTREQARYAFADAMLAARNK